MLKPASFGTIGITEGRGIKLGIGGISIDPLEDNDVAMLKYVQFTAGMMDSLGILADDEESLPCVEREWKLDAFPDTELTDLAAAAWQHMSELISDTVVWLGGDEMPTTLERGHRNKVRIKMYNRERLREIAEEMATTGGAQPGTPAEPFPMNCFPSPTE